MLVGNRCLSFDDFYTVGEGSLGVKIFYTDGAWEANLSLHVERLMFIFNYVALICINAFVCLFLIIRFIVL